MTLFALELASFLTKQLGVQTSESKVGSTVIDQTAKLTKRTIDQGTNVQVIVEAAAAAIADIFALNQQNSLPAHNIGAVEIQAAARAASSRTQARRSLTGVADVEQGTKPESLNAQVRIVQPRDLLRSNTRARRGWRESHQSPPPSRRQPPPALSSPPRAAVGRLSLRRTVSLSRVDRSDSNCSTNSTHERHALGI